MGVNVPKDEIFEKEPEARSFFLVAGISLTGKYGDISQTDMLGYLALRRVESSKMTKLFQSIGQNLQ